jgi:hypothetical protein
MEGKREVKGARDRGRVGVEDLAEGWPIHRMQHGLSRVSSTTLIRSDVSPPNSLQATRVIL